MFNVVGAENGIVDHSSVTAGNPGGYAQFQLEHPEPSNLAQTMAALSRLRYASVVSRTDNTQDVNNQYVGANRAARRRPGAAHRAAQAARERDTTQQQIDSLKAQIRDAEASIASDEATLHALNHQISYSQVSVTINAGHRRPPVSTDRRVHARHRPRTTPVAC